MQGSAVRTEMRDSSGSCLMSESKRWLVPDVGENVGSLREIDLAFIELGKRQDVPLGEIEMQSEPWCVMGCDSPYHIG
jgi:hypothetical protein